MQIIEISGLPVAVELQNESLVLDCSRPDDPRVTPQHHNHTGPRLWLERNETKDAWRVFIHAGDNFADDCEPILTVVLPDAEDSIPAVTILSSITITKLS